MTTKPYDPTLKTLVEIEPQSWPVLLGYAKAPTEVIDADIATVSGAADKVLRVAGDPAYLLHLEFVSGHDAATLPAVETEQIGGVEQQHGVAQQAGRVHSLHAPQTLDAAATQLLPAGLGDVADEVCRGGGRASY